MKLKNPTNVDKLSTMIAKHCGQVFLKTLKLYRYLLFFIVDLILLKFFYFKGINSFILIYIQACKCKHSSCLHLPCTAALSVLYKKIRSVLIEIIYTSKVNAKSQVLNLDYGNFFNLDYAIFNWCILLITIFNFSKFCKLFLCL